MKKRYQVRVIRDISQFLDVVDAASATQAQSIALTIAADYRADSLFAANDEPYDGWDLDVNREDIELVKPSTPLTNLAAKPAVTPPTLSETL